MCVCVLYIHYGPFLQTMPTAIKEKNTQRKKKKKKNKSCVVFLYVCCAIVELLLFLHFCRRPFLRVCHPIIPFLFTKGSSGTAGGGVLFFLNLLLDVAQ